MKVATFCVLFASIAFGQDYRVTFCSHEWGLTFGSTNLSEDVKIAICNDMNIGASRFGANDFVLDATAYAGSEEPFQGSLNFMISPAAIPWGCGGMPYTVTNGTHQLYLLDEICISYTNAIRFTNEHAMAVQQLPRFIELYGNSYTNYNMSYVDKAAFVWNPKVMNSLTPEQKIALCNSYVTTNGLRPVAYVPSMLEYKILHDVSYSNVPLLVCYSTAKYTSRVNATVFLAPRRYVFVEGGWRIFLPERP